MSITIDKLLKSMADELQKVTNSYENAINEAWWILEKILNKNRAQILAAKHLEITEVIGNRINDLVSERVGERKPLQYILGFVPFCDLEILVEPPILIPRPETEEYCHWLIEQIKDEFAENHSFRILDICCGTGCIALALANALPNSELVGIDINPNAIALSNKNKAHNKIENVTFIQSNLFDAIKNYENSFDIIISNPPYLTETEWKSLDKEVKDWEDKQALIASNFGLYFYEEIAKNASNFLKKTKFSDIPNIVLEIGYTQAKSVVNILDKAKFKNIVVHKDLEGKDRFITAKFE